MSAETITLGCRLNFAESEVLKARAPDGAIVVNSCAVTNEAVRQTRQAIRRARRSRLPLFAASQYAGGAHAAAGARTG